ncbi:TonB-dependent siderophore receptor [Methylomonas sp. MgM2]
MACKSLSRILIKAGRFFVKYSITHNISVILTFALGLGLVQATFASEQTINYSIPAQSLNNALIKFAVDSKLELIFSADMVRGIQVDGLKGQMTPKQALNTLLKNTGLDYRFIDTYTVTLVLREPVTKSPTEPISISTMAAVTVLGENDRVYDEKTGSLVTDEDPRSYRASHVISATRTDTPVKEVPQSVQTIKRSLIDDQQNITLSETLYNVSSVVPRNVLYTPVIEGTLVRGFRAEQLVDGFTQYYNPGDRESTVNLERIEVVKGSNAVLYAGGSGSPVGGVINVVSKLPRDQPFADVGFRLGSYDFYQPYFDWNQPVSDNLLFRVTGQYTDSESEIDVIHTRRFNINPTVVLTDRDSTSLRIQGKISRWRQPEYQGLPATGTLVGYFHTPEHTFIGPADVPTSHSDSDAVWASLDHVIDSVWSVSVKARYAAGEFDQKSMTVFGSDGSVGDTPLVESNWTLVNGELFQSQREYSALAYATAAFSWGSSENTFLLGGDYSYLKDVGFLNADFIDSSSVDLSRPEFSYAYNDPTIAYNNSVVSNTTYGGYLQLQSTLFRRFHSLLSLRLGGVEIDFQDKVSMAEVNTQILKPLPRIGGVVDLTDDISLFAGYGEGMRGQPYVNFSGAPYPELSKQIEAGIKFDFSGRFSGQMAVYQIERDHVAVSDPTNPFRSIAAGRQRSQGIETDLVWQPNDSVGVLANYAYTQAEFSDALAGVPSGNRLPLVPEYTGRFWANYRFRQDGIKGLSIGLGVYLSAGAYLSNNNQFKTSGYHRFDAAIAYETTRFKLATSVKNLTNQDYFQPFNYFAGRVAPADGISVYFSAVVKF